MAFALVFGACAACQVVTQQVSAAETPVARQVLAPAPDAPVVDLCLATLQTLSDGRVRPLLCRNGGVNVLAWKAYVHTSDSLFRMGADTTQFLAANAVCDDLGHNHATRAQEADAFILASTYNGWTFLVDIAHDSCI